MKAWLLKDFKGLDQLQLADIPDPVAGKGEAVLKIELAGLNPADRYLSEGQYPAKPSLPHILGRDGLGTIISTAPDVREFKVGDRAIILRSEIGVNRAGTFAEKVAVPVASLAPVPTGWSEEQAAGAALVYLTAHQALTQWGELPPSVVLVTGASGGVGVATTQLAVAAGHTTVALSRSAGKCIKLKELGASICLDPQDPKWPEQLKSALGNRRVDLAVDNVAGPLLNAVIGTLANHGKVSVVGALAGPVPQFNTATLFGRRIRIGGVTVGAYAPEESQTAWNEIIKILTRANAKPLVDSTFPFEKLKEAFVHLSEGPMGKVLLTVKKY
jgi:NADPH2:quinone reductase